MKPPGPPKPSDADDCTGEATCACGVHPEPPRADETCQLTRTIKGEHLALTVWSCSAPTPRPPQGDFTVGVFRRGEPIPARELWPGSVESWSCNTGKFPGHADLVLYLGGVVEADRTRAAILKHDAAQEARRLAADSAASARTSQSPGLGLSIHWTTAMSAALKKQREAEQADPRRAAKAAAAAKRAALRSQKRQELEARVLQRLLATAIRKRFQKSFQARIGPRVRRFFYVSRRSVQQEDVALEYGWYVETVNPPASWINTDAFGPCPSLQHLIRDVFAGYRAENDQ